ncbi:MAG: hypothetical protein OQK51_14640 [Kangiellaceae bacterium]|nr:hypothetical protein [Kangiellaceae bacterium]
MLIGEILDANSLESLKPIPHLESDIANTHSNHSVINHSHSAFSLATLLMIVGCYFPCVTVSLVFHRIKASLLLFLSHALPIPFMVISSAHLKLSTTASASALSSHLHMLLTMSIGILVGAIVLNIFAARLTKRLLLNSQ